MPGGLGTRNALKRLNKRTMRTRKSALEPTNSILGTDTVIYTRTEGQCLGMWFFGFFVGVAFTIALTMLVNIFINHVRFV